MRRIILLFLLSTMIFAGFSVQPTPRSVKAEGEYSLVNANIRTPISNRCPNESIGFREYTINGSYNSSTHLFTGNITIRGQATTTGTNLNFIIATSFPIYNSKGEILERISFNTPNLIPINYSFSLILNEDPVLIRASLYQTLTSGICNGFFQDSEEFFFEEDVTNGIFQVPCSSVNQFSLAPNKVQPNDQVTVQWNVSNLVQDRVVRISGSGLSPTDRTTPTGSLTFTAPSSPGTYEYTLQVLDHNGNAVDCPPPSRQTLTVGGGRYFWLVKRMNPLDPITPVGSPFEYYSEKLATPFPPGSNPTGSFIRVPESGDFQAPSFEEALTLSPFNEQAIQALLRMKCRDNRNYPPSGLISPDKAQAIAEYQNALESYRQALATFQNASPKPGSGLVGPGNLSHARKTSEEVSPYDN